MLSSSDVLAVVLLVVLLELLPVVLCVTFSVCSAEDSNIDNLAAKYDAEPANTAVDDELAALKAQMGIE